MSEDVRLNFNKVMNEHLSEQMLKPQEMRKAEFGQKKIKTILTHKEIDDDYDHEEQLREMAQREIERSSRSKIQPALSPAISPENFDFAQSVAL